MAICMCQEARGQASAVWMGAAYHWITVSQWSLAVLKFYCIEYTRELKTETERKCMYRKTVSLNE